MAWLETIDDLTGGADALRGRRYGVIETHAGRLVSVQLRPWPCMLTWPEVWPVGPDWRPAGPPDRCRLYYNQPRGHEGFLALKYVACTEGTGYRTFRAALDTLDAIAAVKRSDAIVCDASNDRLSDRFLRRRGWRAHAPAWRRRNYIRRFYGNYPDAALRLAGC